MINFMMLMMKWGISYTSDYTINGFSKQWIKRVQENGAKQKIFFSLPILINIQPFNCRVPIA